MSDIKIEQEKPVSGLNKNLARYANDTKVYSHVKSTANMSKTGVSLEKNLSRINQSIQTQIEKRKEQDPSAANQLEELNSLTNELNKGQLHVNTNVQLKIASTILACATSASLQSTEDSGIRNPHSPTHTYFSTGSMNTIEDVTPRVLIAVDASGSMWWPRTRLVGAANLLASIAKRLSRGGAKLNYAFWDDGCDIPKPFSVSIAKQLAKSSSIKVNEPGEAILQTSVGGGGTNVFSVADRLSPYVYPPELDDNGNILPKVQRGVKYTKQMKKQYHLTYGTDYNLIVIYSDFDFPSNPAYSIPSNEADMKWRFDQIALSKLCCVCCSSTGERETPEAFKHAVKKWIPFSQWEKEIKFYSCQNPDDI